MSSGERAEQAPLRRVEPPRVPLPARLLAKLGSLVVRGTAAAATTTRGMWLRRRAAERFHGGPAPRRLCLGSGRAPIPGWTNIDLGPAGDVHLDLRFGIPLPDASVERIYSEHVIEHFTREEGLALFRECRRLLAAGGVLRVATPDLAAVMRVYETGQWERYDHPHWPEYSTLDSPVRLVNAVFHEWGHKYLYDFAELQLRLRQAGFSEVRRCALGDSEVPDLRALETRRDSTLVVEAVSPAGRS